MIRRERRRHAAPRSAVGCRPRIWPRPADHRRIVWALPGDHRGNPSGLSALRARLVSFFGEDLIAQIDALVADIHAGIRAGSAYELLDLLLRSAAASAPAANLLQRSTTAGSRLLAAIPSAIPPPRQPPGGTKNRSRTVRRHRGHRRRAPPRRPGIRRQARWSRAAAEAQLGAAANA